MKIIHTLSVILLLAFDSIESSSQSATKAGPIQLLPKNPHYFLYKGKPLALITSAEHYGAVLNTGFDYKKYLQTLSSEGMNYTRIFTGSYFEISGESFGIQNNTLAPAKENILIPWKKNSSGGGAKYDLSQWNDVYFQRLKDFMALAEKLNIIVEVTLFSSIYTDGHWDINPQNPANNINISHEIKRLDAHTLTNGDLLPFQIAYVEKLVEELNAFDNFFFEIQNEPWADRRRPVYNIVNKEDLNPKDWELKVDFADDASLAWQEKIASTIHEKEKALPKKHLIAQNYSNFKAPIPHVNEYISILNFHYAWPEAVKWNYHYDKVIGFDESGFAGNDDEVYRRQAWQFMLSGGGLFNNLDYSFFVGNETGLGKNEAPGGGSKALRRQLKILSDFLHSFTLENLHPDVSLVKSSPGLIPYLLTDGKNEFAVFIKAIATDKTFLEIETGKGNFAVQTLNTLTGEFSAAKEIAAKDGVVKFDVKIPEGELAIKMVRK